MLFAAKLFPAYGVTTLYASMLALSNLPASVDVALRICTSAAEALPCKIGERFTAHFGAVILDSTGSTQMLRIFIPVLRMRRECQSDNRSNRKSIKNRTRGAR